MFLDRWCFLVIGMVLGGIIFMLGIEAGRDRLMFFP